MTRFKYLFFLFSCCSGLPFLSAQNQSTNFDHEIQQLVNGAVSVHDDLPQFLLALQDSIVYFIKQQNAPTRFHDATTSIDLQQLKLTPALSSRNSHLSVELEILLGGKLDYFFLQVYISGYGRRKSGREERKSSKDYEALRQHFLSLYPNVKETHRPNGDRPEEWTALFYDDTTYSRAIFRVSKFQGGCIFSRGILLDYVAKNPAYQH